MRKGSLFGVTAFAGAVIIVLVFVVLSFEGGLTGGVASYDPIQVGPEGYAGYPGYASSFAVQPSGVQRTLPGRSMADMETLNFGSLDDLLNLLVQQFSTARSAGYITESQYNAVAEDAVFIYRLGIRAGCISEHDARTAVRVLIGTGKSERFKEQYSKAFDCLNAKGVLKPAEVVEEDAPAEEVPAPSYPMTVYEGNWTVNADGILQIRGYSGEFALSSMEDPVNVSIEVVEGGFNAVDGLLLEIRDVIDDQNFEIRAGTLTRDEIEIPVTVRRVRD